MRKFALAVLLLQVLVLNAAAAEPPKDCTLCAGVVADVTAVPPAALPLLVELQEDQLSTAGTLLDSVAPETRKRMTVVIDYSVAGAADPLIAAEEKTKQIIEWARLHGPFEALGAGIVNAEPTLAAYAIKRLAVTAQGLGVASRIVLPRGQNAAALFENGAQAYFDVLLVDGKDVESTMVWLAERDPSKKLYATVAAESPNALYDAARALASGATRAFAVAPAPAVAEGFAQFNRAMAGDWAFDSTAKTTVLDAKGTAMTMPVLSFVRGEDLRTLLVPRGDAAGAMILSLPDDQYKQPRRVDAAGEKVITDSASRNGRLLVGNPVTQQPFAVIVDRAEKLDTNVTKETISVATQRGIAVEEIIRNHQAYDAFQESIQPRYIAKNTTKLRFDIGGGAEALEAAIAGDYFSDPTGRADWVWQDFFINGVRWKYGKIPELPLIQPEKVTQLPLDIHLTNEYRYELVRETDVEGYHTYEVRFEPPRNAPEGLPLYRGTVWIDAHSWARIRISMIQLNLTGEVLSNEERMDFIPFARDTNAVLTAAEVGKRDAKSVLWLPLSVTAQQVVSAAGRASVVQRATTFENFRINPTEYETLLTQASASDARMVRETKAGLRYLEKRNGERVVKEGFDTSQIFALGGVHHDGGLEYPVVPLGGVDYFNFNLFGKGIQTNVFFAGVVLAANATHPNVANTRTNVGLDFFGIAVPTENTAYRNGIERPEEGIKSRPMGLFARVGHPFLQFGKIDLSLGASHLTYSSGEDTADDFVVPTSTFVITPGIELRYTRRGWSFSGSYDYNRRTTWEPWGNVAEFDPEQKTYTHFGMSVGKSFYLPKFQRIGVDVSYLDGQRLDRFSKYELGFFGAQRVHGVRSGSVRAEQALIGHLSYGFVFSEQIRLEAFYDHAVLDDVTSGYRRAPFQGLGIAGQMVGPYATLVRLDIGKTIGRNAQDGFVANVVFLKLF
ncbi:MAG: hypothetical protein QOH21_2637 [Acidobacteriota bacterium]|jgi:hypothetical protein|nr:hypothetical protein [Acidobacteriota bacterium]